MTTVATIINDAFRQSNLIPINGSVSASQQDEAFRHLERILESVVGNEAGENLLDYPIGSKNVQYGYDARWQVNGSTIIPPNRRLVCNLAENTTVYLNPVPDDGERVSALDTSNTSYTLTVQGNGRLIEGATSVTLSGAGFSRDWFYRADLGQWVKLSPITSTNDTFPYPQAFDDFFITLLAMRLNPSYGTQMDPQTQATFTRSRTQFRARYHPTIPVPSEAGLLRMPKTAVDRYLWTYGWYGYDPQNAFNKGTIW